MLAFSRIVLCSLAVLVCGLHAPPVSAQQSSQLPLRSSRRPPTRGHLQLVAGYIHGVALDDVSPNPLSGGLGLRLGVTTSQGKYVGLIMDYHAGEHSTGLVAFEDEDTGEKGTREKQFRNRALLVGAALGYDLRLSETLVLRAGGMAGIHHASLGPEEDEVGAQTDTDLAVGPFADVVWLLGDELLVTSGMRFNAILQTTTLTTLTWTLAIGFPS